MSNCTERKAIDELLRVRDLKCVECGHLTGSAIVDGVSPRDMDIALLVTSYNEALRALCPDEFDYEYIEGGGSEFLSARAGDFNYLLFLSTDAYDSSQRLAFLLHDIGITEKADRVKLGNLVLAGHSAMALSDELSRKYGRDPDEEERRADINGSLHYGAVGWEVLKAYLKSHDVPVITTETVEEARLYWTLYNSLSDWIASDASHNERFAMENVDRIYPQVLYLPDGAFIVFEG
ncbi:MAG: hypothetical protein KAI66_26495 [Lentisphaeria bacterium]|nr:hypothetical protein [Lentisphaeria bacterium]